MKNSLPSGDNPLNVRGYLQYELPRVLGKEIVLLGLIFASFALPAVIHSTGLPVRWILPMHLPVIIAGVVYGWRTGLIVGMCAPLTNWLLTGFPYLPVLPAMTIELSIYGGLTGFLSQKSTWRMTLAIGVSLLAGRIGFLGTIILTGGYNGTFGKYAIAAMAPGIAALFGQMLLIPLVFSWIRKKPDSGF